MAEICNIGMHWTELLCISLVLTLVDLTSSAM